MARVSVRTSSCGLAAILGALALAAAPAAADAKKTSEVKLRDPSTGFSMVAPKGSRLYRGGGGYVIARGRDQARYALYRTPQSAESAGAALIEQLKYRVTSQKATVNSFAAKLAKGAQRRQLRVRDRGAVLEVRDAFASSPKRLKALNSALNTARGGGRATLALPNTTQAVQPIELEQYESGGASALVPKGWRRSGENGAIVAQSGQGELGFGIYVRVMTTATGDFCRSSYACQVPPGTLEYDPMDSEDSMMTLINAFRQESLGEGPSKTMTDFVVERRGGVTVPGFRDSDLYIVDYQFGGRPWKGAFLVATSDTIDSSSMFGTISEWGMYFSYIAVPATDDSSVSQALVQSWESWDASRAVADRISEIQKTLNETTEIVKEATAFRQKVFDQANADWAAYIRGSNTARGDGKTEPGQAYPVDPKTGKLYDPDRGNQILDYTDGLPVDPNTGEFVYQ